MSKLPPIGPPTVGSPNAPVPGASVAARVFPRYSPTPHQVQQRVDAFVRTPVTPLTTAAVLVGGAALRAELHDPISVAHNLRFELNALESAVRRSGLTEQKGEVLRLNARINRLIAHGGTVGDAQAINAGIAALRASL